MVKFRLKGYPLEDFGVAENSPEAQQIKEHDGQKIVHFDTVMEGYCNIEFEDGFRLEAVSGIHIVSY